MIVAKIIVGLVASWLALVGFDTFVARPFGIVNIIPHRRSAHRDRRIWLLAEDEVVAQLEPESFMQPDGTLPNIIEYQGRTFERGWTNDGNTDADERLWFEVKQ